MGGVKKLLGTNIYYYNSNSGGVIFIYNIYL